MSRGVFISTLSHLELDTATAAHFSNSSENPYLHDNAGGASLLVALTGEVVEIVGDVLLFGRRF